MKYFIVFFLLISNYSFTQSKLENDSIIIWNSNRKICWKDFELEVAKEWDAEHHAAVSSQVIIRPKVVSNCKELKFIAIFEKKQSWVAFKTTNLLKHEQLHFDIVELFARKMRKYFDEETIENLSDGVKCNSAIDSFINDLINYQILYDQETKHGTIKDKQEEWDEIISQKLEDLKKYELIIEIDELD